MKTAIIFYGFFRTFEFCSWTLEKHVLNTLDADVFFSTPDTIYTRKEDEVQDLHHVFSRHDKRVDENIINFFGNRLKAYQIRGYSSQLYKDFIKAHNIPEYNNFTKQLTWKISSSLHSFSSSINVFKNYVELTKSNYDAVIITRPDVRYYNDFNLNVIDFNKINCPKYFAIDPSHEELTKFLPEKRKDINIRRRPGGAGVHGFNRWLNDNILVGNQHNILKFSNIFENLDLYHKNGVCFNYETIIGYHMIKNNIPFTDTDFVTYELWRPDRFEW